MFILIIESNEWLVHSPLCEEEMVGCCFIIENVDYCVREISDPQIQEQTSSLSPLQEHEEERKEEENKHKEKEKEEDKHMTAITDTYGPFTGQVKFIQFILQIICTMTDACRRAFLYAHPRLVEGLYLCSLQLTSDMLGKVYAVIDQRRGKVIIYFAYFLLDGFRTIASRN
jgi:translation elongation factor EF-G